MWTIKEKLQLIKLNKLAKSARWCSLPLYIVWYWNIACNEVFVPAMEGCRASKEISISAAKQRPVKQWLCLSIGLYVARSNCFALYILQRDLTTPTKDGIGLQAICDSKNAFRLVIYTLNLYSGEPLESDDVICFLYLWRPRISQQTPYSCTLPQCIPILFFAPIDYGGYVKSPNMGTFTALCLKLAVRSLKRLRDVKNPEDFRKCPRRHEISHSSADVGDAIKKLNKTSNTCVGIALDSGS